jgi:hypothetical protein
MTQHDDAPRRTEDADTPPGMPRWVKVAAVVVGLLILVFLVLQLTGLAGDHGPGMHSSTGSPAVSGAAERLPADG